MQRKVISLLTALILVCASPAIAQKYVPKTIRFKGAPDYSDQELLAAAGLKNGVALSAADINERSKQLMDSGLFENLTYQFDGQVLTFQLIPAASLYVLRMENLPPALTRDLESKLHERFPLFHGKVPAEGGLTEGVRNALEEMLAALGIKASVLATPFTDPIQHKVTAIGFSIMTPAVQIGEFRLDPASAALDPKATEILAKLTGSPYDTVGSPSQIATYLGNYYRDKGYAEAAIRATPEDSATVTPEAIRVPFLLSIAPGPQYRLTGVQLAPGCLVTQAEFDRQSHIHPGDIADGQHVTENWMYLSRQYHNHGFLKAAVHPTPAFDRAQNTVSYTVAVDPGPVYTMGKLSVENVSDDLRAAILNAWKIPPGAVFNEGAILSMAATHGVNPLLERVFPTVNIKYVLHLNDETSTVDVVLRLERRL